MHSASIDNPLYVISGMQHRCSEPHLSLHPQVYEDSNVHIHRIAIPIQRHSFELETLIPKRAYSFSSYSFKGDLVINE